MGGEGELASAQRALLAGEQRQQPQLPGMRDQALGGQRVGHLRGIAARHRDVARRRQRAGPEFDMLQDRVAAGIGPADDQQRGA